MSDRYRIGDHDEGIVDTDDIENLKDVDLYKALRIMNAADRLYKHSGDIADIIESDKDDDHLGFAMALVGYWNAVES